jgi:hypothetical protein
MKRTLLNVLPDPIGHLIINSFVELDCEIPGQAGNDAHVVDYLLKF